MMSWTMCPVEDARRMRETAVHNVGVQKRKQFSVEDGSLVECAVCGTRVLENLSAFPKSWLTQPF